MTAIRRLTTKATIKIEVPRGHTARPRRFTPPGSTSRFIAARRLRLVRRADAVSPPPASDRTTAAGVVLCADGLARPAWATADDLLREYYDTEWGMPVRDERGMFERVSLEAFQSGLSWATILRKRPAFRDVFHNFDPDTVADYDEADVERLLSEPRIVRNRRKIEATIGNARATVDLRADGGLAELVWSFQPRRTPRPRKFADIPTTSEEAVALSRELRKRGFAFVGPTTMFALMEAVGIVDTHLLGSHRRGSSGVWSDTGRRSQPPDGPDA